MYTCIQEYMYTCTHVYIYKPLTLPNEWKGVSQDMNIHLKLLECTQVCKQDPHIYQHTKTYADSPHGFASSETNSLVHRFIILPFVNFPHFARLVVLTFHRTKFIREALNRPNPLRASGTLKW